VIPFNEQAVLKLLALKQRPMAKGLILIAANVAANRTIFAVINPRAAKNVWLSSWPAAQDMGCACQPPLYRQWIRGEHLSLAIRVSAHAPVHSLV
jgi:L-threonylcarbamoyladenylate synthase